MKDYKEYKKSILLNRKLVDIIGNGDLSIENCIDELELLGYRIVNSVDLANVVKSWSEIKDGDEFTVKCKVVKGKFELNLD